MNGTHLARLALPLVLLTCGSGALAGQASLESCRTWQGRIDHYTELRRDGGRVAKMERWKRSRDGYQDKFRRGNCRRFGSKVRPKAR